MTCNWCSKQIPGRDVESCHPLCYLKKWDQADYLDRMVFKLRTTEQENKKAFKFKTLEKDKKKYAL